MKPFEKIRCGMGVGGWMTNYKRIRYLPPEYAFVITEGDKEHFENFLTLWDIRNIRSFGMDHIRLPFDQVVLEEYDKPFSYREDMLKLLDRMIHWCLEERLEVILNLHHAIGCYCDFAEGSTLMEDEDKQVRFIRLWEMLEDRYHQLDIVFEILNESTTPDADKWNRLAHRCVAAIRRKNPARRIIVGSTQMNRVDRLKDLELFDDDYVGYTFHYYGPFPFVKQRSMTTPIQYLYNREIPYPGDNSYYNDYNRFAGKDPHEYDKYPVVGREYIEHTLQPAVDFKNAHPDKFLWFGEFGSIRHARTEWRENWMRDVIRFAVEHDIPFSNWNYLSTPYDCNRFSLVTDEERKIISPELLKLIQGKV